MLDSRGLASKEWRLTVRVPVPTSMSPCSPHACTSGRTSGTLSRPRRAFSENGEAGKKAYSILQVGSVEHFPNENQPVDSLSNGNTFLGNEDKARTSFSLDEQAEVVLDRVHVMADQHPASSAAAVRTSGSSRPSRGTASARRKSRVATRRSIPANDRMFQIRICLKPDPHACLASRRFRASSIRSWSSGLAGLAVRSNSSHLFSNSRR